MKTTIKDTEFNVSYPNAFHPYGERTESIAWKLKTFLQNLDGGKPTIHFSPVNKQFVYRGKELPRVLFVAQYYGHLESWQTYVTSYSHIETLTPGARKYLAEMYEKEINAAVPGMLADFIEQEKTNAKERAMKELNERIEAAKAEIAKVEMFG